MKAEGSVPGYQASVTPFPEHDLAVAFLESAWGLRPGKPPKIADPIVHLAQLVIRFPRQTEACATRAVNYGNGPILFCVGRRDRARRGRGIRITVDATVTDTPMICHT